MDAIDIEIMEIYKDITGVTHALYDIPLSKDEGEDLIKGCCEKMDNWFTKVDLWLNSKTDDEMMRLLRTHTFKSFLYIADFYLHDNKAAFSGMDIEKGYYNINDSFYMHLETWYEVTNRRYKMVQENIVNWMSENSQKETATEPQPEAQITAHDPQPSFLQVEKVVQAFERGVEHGYIIKYDGKYKWIKDKGTLLCALIGTLLFGDEIGLDGDYKTKGGAETFPASDIENYFGLKDISKKRYQLNQKKPPRGYKEMKKKLIEQP